MAEVDTSIYRMQQPVGEGPSIADQFMSSYGAGQNLKTVALKNKQLDTENQMAQMNAHLQKAQTFGNALEGLSNLPEDQRAQQYGVIRDDMVKNGIISPDQAPQQYDPGFYSSTLARYRQTAPAIANQLQKANVGHVGAETALLQSQTPKQQIGGPINPDTDPATLVRQYVPKELHAKAFEEVKNAQDIVALKPKIEDAFKRGGSSDPVVAAQGQRELQALLMTTVKDTEGTVRQAAMDAVKNTMTPSGLTATKGENDAKARTIAEYLASKSSAPIAKGYGIDLSKFNSTKHEPYQEPKTVSPGIGDRLSSVAGSVGKMFNSAQAAEPAASAVKPGTVEQGFVFMGGDPSDQKNWKKR